MATMVQWFQQQAKQLSVKGIHRLVRQCDTPLHDRRDFLTAFAENNLRNGFEEVSNYSALLAGLEGSTQNAIYTNQLAFRKTVFLENPTSIQRPNSLPTFDITRAETKTNFFCHVAQSTELKLCRPFRGIAAEGGSMFLQTVGKSLPERRHNPKQNIHITPQCCFWQPGTNILLQKYTTQLRDVILNQFLTTHSCEIIFILLVYSTTLLLTETIQNRTIGR